MKSGEHAVWDATLIAGSRRAALRLFGDVGAEMAAVMERVGAALGVALRDAMKGVEQSLRAFNAAMEKSPEGRALLRAARANGRKAHR